MVETPNFSGFFCDCGARGNKGSSDKRCQALEPSATPLKIDYPGRTNGQRVFTLGIGANVSRELVNNVARAGCGVSGDGDLGEDNCTNADYLFKYRIRA